MKKIPLDYKNRISDKTKKINWLANIAGFLYIATIGAFYAWIILLWMAE